MEERFGVPPSKYLEYVALKGDPSDNIPGVPGVGEKTAAKLIQQYGSVEELLAHADELRGKLKDNVLASADQLALNKELARIVTDLPLDIGSRGLRAWGSGTPTRCGGCSRRSSSGRCSTGWRRSAS